MRAVAADGARSGPGSVIVNQIVLRRMAEERIVDAAALREAGRWAFAYYVAGYAVECALKSCVLAQMVHTGGVFTSKKFADECFTHDFGVLVRLAGITTMLDGELATNPGFRRCWGIAKAWNETSRYEEKTQSDADKLYLAITDHEDGVMRWVRNYW